MTFESPYEEDSFGTEYAPEGEAESLVAVSLPEVEDAGLTSEAPEFEPDKVDVIRLRTAIEQAMEGGDDDRFV